MTLKVHRCEDSKYDINWVVANHDNVMVNRKYIERHEPTYSGFSIIVKNPDDPKWLMEYGHNEEGFLSVSDFPHEGRVFENMHIKLALQFLEANTANVLADSNIISDCGCTFESSTSNTVILCVKCSLLPCHNK